MDKRVNIPNYIYKSKASRDKYIPTKNQYLANNIIKHLKVCDDVQ